jgi:hypothetical protein
VFLLSLVFMSVGLHTQDTSTEYEHLHEMQRNVPQPLGIKRVENKNCMQAQTYTIFKEAFTWTWVYEVNLSNPNIFQNQYLFCTKYFRKLYIFQLNNSIIIAYGCILDTESCV